MHHGDQHIHADSRCYDICRMLLKALGLFLCHILTTGYSLSFGLFYTPLVEHLETTPSAVGLIGTLNYGILCLTGPLAAFVITRTGCRWSLVLGSVLSFIGLATTSQVPNIYITYLTYGLLTGMGYGFVFATGVVAVNIYFPPQRSIIMGFSLTGIAVGSFINPILIQYLIDTYTWRGALLIQSGLTLHIIPIVLFLGKPIIKLNKPSKKTGLCDSCLMFKFTSLILFMVSFLFCFGMSITYIIIPPWIEHLGFQNYIAVLVLVCLGVANLIGRLLLGLLSHSNRVNVKWLLACCYMLAGCAVMLLPVLHLVPLIAAAAAVFGLFSAAYGPVLSEVTFRLFGPLLFPSVYGAQLVFMGIGSVTGGTITGILIAKTGGFLYILLMAGGCVSLSGLVVVLAKAYVVPESETITVDAECKTAMSQIKCKEEGSNMKHSLLSSQKEMTDA